MKKQTKTIILSIAICMIFALGVFCIFAVQNFSLSSNGIIEFVAPGIDATISQATLSGISKKEGFGQMQEFTITPEMTESQISNLPGVKSWSNIGLVFDEDSGGRASLSFTITNNSSKEIENIMVELSTNTTYESPIHATPSADFCIQPKSSHTFTIDIAVADLQNTISFKGFNLVANLKIIKPAEVLSVTEQKNKNGLTFETNSATKTAVVSKCEDDLVSVEIPSVVKGADGKLYTVTEIKDGSTLSDGVFYSARSTLTSIKLPNTLTKIGRSAFYYCSNIKGDLVLPQGLITLEYKSFERCRGISGDLIIPNTVTEIGEDAFRDTLGLAGKLVLPSNLKTIGACAFYSSNFSGTLKFPKNLEFIGDYAFHNCTDFTGNLVFPDSLITIGDYAFHDCRFNGPIVLGKNIETIGDDAFSNGTFNIGELYLGSSIKSFGEGVFGTVVDTITSIKIDPQNQALYVKDNCLISKQDKILLLGCNSSVIPQDEGITRIGRDAFEDCSELTGTLTIPSTVTEIDYGAFKGCKGFTKLVLPEGLKSISQEAFSSCYGLAGDLVIPNSVTTIWHYAFSSCSKLTSITIGSGVTEMGGSVFSNCSKIVSLTILATTPPEMWGGLVSPVDNFQIYVPAESVDLYKAAENWSSYSSKIQAIS